MDTKEYLAFIAWDGESLASFRKLPDDLHFRALLTAAFSPDKTFSPKGIRDLLSRAGYSVSISGWDRFRELLVRAIGSAQNDPQFLDEIQTGRKIAPDIKTTERGDTRDYSELWAARIPIFRELFDDPDFPQFILEARDSRTVFETLIQWVRGLHAPARKPEQSAAPAPLNPNYTYPSYVNSLWNNMAIHLAQGLALAVPLTVGATVAATIVVQRQADLRTDSASPSAADTATMAKLALVMAQLTDQVTVNQTMLNKIDDLKTSISETDRPTLCDEGCKTTMTGSLVLDTRGQAIPVKLDDKFAQLNLSLPDLPREYTVWLGNASLAPHSPVPADPPGSGGKKIQPAPPAQNTAASPQTSSEVVPAGQAKSVPNTTGNAAPASSDVRPFEINARVNDLTVSERTLNPLPEDYSKQTHLLEFDSLLTAQALPADAVGQKVDAKWKNSSAYLCDWNLPVRLLLLHAPSPTNGTSTTAPPPSTPQCQAQAPADGKYASLSKTPAYVKELDAYLSTEQVSGRRFGLFGVRRLVVKVTPGTLPSKPN